MERWSDNPVKSIAKELSSRAYVRKHLESGRIEIVEKCPLTGEINCEVQLDKEEVEKLLNWLG